MHFVHSLSWWLAVLLACIVGVLAFLEYRRPIAPLAWARRGTLIALRALALAALLLVVLRPIALLPPASARDASVPVLVDVSRSMRIADADGQARIARAASLVKSELLPALSRQFSVELFGVGETLAPTTVESLSASASQTDLNGALTMVRERTRGRRVAGIILISDGADTGLRTGADALRDAATGPAVFAIGVGAAGGLRDREVVGVTAGEQRLDQASVDLHVSVTSSGFGRTPFQLRLLANGRLLDTRRVVPPSDGSPIDERFTVSPDPLTATVYTAEIPVDPSEPVVENNARSVLVSPAGRKRRVLIVEGAPGFEHSFMERAWARDPALEVDSVVRKGKNADGNNTFFVRAAAGRASALTNGFPARREDLYAYDALVIANVEGDFFTRAQLMMVGDFVAERGGGLLVTGGRSFAQRGLVGTPVEAVLPVELDDRRGALVRTSFASRDAHNKLMVTPEGETHPIMRIGDSAEDTRKLWTSLPTLAASAPLGGPRPGATVLAVTSAPSGIRPVVAVQRYGQGRSMIFAGEASWRWKMMLPAADRTYELFWRQAARWLTSSSPDAVAMTVPDAPEPGDSISIDVDARDASFTPVADATVEAAIASPGGEERPLTLRRVEAAGGRFTSAIHLDAPGLYRVRAAARRGATSLGAAEKWMYVGGADREFVDPRLNEPFLRRIARASGGRYLRAADASHVVSWLQSTARQSAPPERRDLWHEPWILAAIALLLSTEWVLRRRWGLR